MTLQRCLVVVLLANAASAAPAAATETKGQGRSLITLHQVHAWLNKHGWGPTMKPTDAPTDAPTCIPRGQKCHTGVDEEKCCIIGDECTVDVDMPGTPGGHMKGAPGTCQLPNCKKAGEACTTCASTPADPNPVCNCCGALCVVSSSEEFPCPRTCVKVNEDDPDVGSPGKCEDE